MPEPLVKTPKCKISVTATPAPRWSGQVFFCEKCLAPNQLEAGDACMPLGADGWEYLTPACPTRGCDHRSRILLPAGGTVALLRMGLEQDATNGPDKTGEILEFWNAS
jgi:hypothetical protein